MIQFFMYLVLFQGLHDVSGRNVTAHFVLSICLLVMEKKSGTFRSDVCMGINGSYADKRDVQGQPFVFPLFFYPSLLLGPNGTK